MVQHFGGILRGRKLLMVFYGDRDLSMLHNQIFQNIDINEEAWTYDESFKKFRDLKPQFES